VHEAWYKYNGIALERGAWPHEIDVKPQTPNALVPAEGKFVVPEIFALRLDHGGPVCLIVIDESDGSLPCLRQSADLLQLAPYDFCLFSADREFVEPSQIEAGMHLLLSERRLPPAKVADDFSAVG